MSYSLTIRSALKLCDFAISVGKDLGDSTDLPRISYDRFYAIAEDACRSINPGGAYQQLLVRTREEAPNSLNGKVPETLRHLEILREAIEKKAIPSLVDDTTWFLRLSPFAVPAGTYFVGLASRHADDFVGILVEWARKTLN